jgi:hypothetical protein
MKIAHIFFCFCLAVIFGLPAEVNAQEGKIADKPLFRDPVYDGAADPVVIWNRKEEKWFMFYTNRRANATNVDGVTWVHGTRIGIAESKDGATWKYRDTANINYRPVKEYTHWAPEVIDVNGVYHMFLTYVPGIFTDWQHPRDIIHLTSKDLLNWDYVSTLKLASDRVIDPCVMRLPDGTWRMWYNNERDSKSIYYADSPDLITWTDKIKAVGDKGGEGPKVFSWKGKYWMIVDNWAGLGVYSSDDMTNWKRQEERLVEKPGKGADDQAIGGHADILVNNGRAFLFYFTHPGRAVNARTSGAEARRSLIQLTELHLKNDGTLTCDRDEPVRIALKAP